MRHVQDTCDVENCTPSTKEYDSQFHRYIMAASEVMNLGSKLFLVVEVLGATLRTLFGLIKSTCSL